MPTIFRYTLLIGVTPFGEKQVEAQKNKCHPKFSRKLKRSLGVSPPSRPFMPSW